jgi:cysteine desulfurase
MWYNFFSGSPCEYFTFPPTENRKNKMRPPIYLDYNATTPHDPEVIAAMLPYLKKYFGNPSSSHRYGVQTRGAIENARAQVALLLNCRPEEIIFTSGGTESNNHAIKGIAFAHKVRGNHIITSQIEHPAVTEVCEFLHSNGFDITYLPVDEFAQVNISDVEKAITPKTILITIMHANNEVGTIQAIEEISKLAREYGIIMHTDAAQSVGKIITNIDMLGVDLLSVAGHKLYAPKGVGALYSRQGVKPAKFIHGAGQEQGKRAGTENVLEIVGLGKACEIAKRDMDENIKRMREMRDMLHNGLMEKFKDLRLNGHRERRLPNTVSLSFPGLNAGMLLSEIKDYVAASAGAACHSGVVEISHVLKAMNVPAEWAKGTLRLTTGKMTTEKEIHSAINVLSKVLKRCQIKKAGVGF